MMNNHATFGTVGKFAQLTADLAMYDWQKSQCKQALIEGKYQHNDLSMPKGAVKHWQFMSAFQ